LLCACAYGVKSEISLDTSDSASNAVVKHSVLSVFINQRCAECMCLYYVLRVCGQKKHYYMWPFAKKLYHGWISTMTSSNEILWKLPSPKWRAGCAPAIKHMQVCLEGMCNFPQFTKMSLSYLWFILSTLNS